MDATAPPPNSMKPNGGARPSPRRGGLLNRVKNRSNNRVSLPHARTTNRRRVSSSNNNNVNNDNYSRASLLYASSSTSSVASTSNNKNSKLYKLASDYESILKKVWDPVPGIRLVVDGDAVIKELKKLQDEEFGNNNNNEMFWDNSNNKKTFPVLCNYLTVWRKRRKSTGMGKSQSSTTISKKMKKSDIIDKSKTINVTENMKDDNSSSTSNNNNNNNSDNTNDRIPEETNFSMKTITHEGGKNSILKGETSQEYQERKNENQLAKRNIVEGEANSNSSKNNNKKVEKKVEEEEQQQQSVKNTSDNNNNNNNNDKTEEDDEIIQSTTRNINGQVVELAILDADPNIGVRARLNGYKDKIMLVKEDDMLGILLNNGISENDLGSMDLIDIIEKLLSFVNVKLTKENIELGFDSDDNNNNINNKNQATSTEEEKVNDIIQIPEISTLTFENIETGHVKSIEEILIFNNDTCLVSCSMDKSAHLWTYSTSNTNFAIQSKKVLFGHNDVVTCVSTCGSWICTGSRDKTVRIWNMEVDNADAIVVNAHDDVVRDVEIFTYNNNMHIVSASRDKTIKVWNFDGNKNECVLGKTWKGHTKPVVALSNFVTEHACIVSSSNDKTLRIWDMNKENESIVLKGHEKAISCVKVTKLVVSTNTSGTDEWVVVSGSSDKSVRIWSLKDGLCLHVIQPFKKAVIQLSILKNDNINKNACLALTSDGKINLIDLASAKVVIDDFIIKENKLVLNGATIRSVTSSNGANDGSNSCFFGLRDGKIAVASVKMGNDVRDSNSNNSNGNSKSSIISNDKTDYVTWDQAVVAKAKENIDASTIPKSNDGGTYVNITENMLGNLKQAPVMMYNSKKNTWNDAIIWRENINGSFDLYLISSNDRKVDVGPSKLLISSKYVDDNQLMQKSSSNVLKSNHHLELKIDLKVLSRYQCGWEYYGATIKGIDNGTVKLLYDDGEEETINRLYLKAYDTLYHTNDLVEVKYKGKKKWYRGTVQEEANNGRYTVKYNLDGEIETNVKRKSLWYVDLNVERKEKEVSYNVGDAVLCRHNRGARFFGGKIEHIYHSDGVEKKFDVLYDDGDTEKEVERWLIKKKN